MKILPLVFILSLIVLEFSAYAAELSKVTPPKKLETGWRFSNLPTTKVKAYEEYEKLYDSFVDTAASAESLYKQKPLDALKKNIDDLNKLAKSPHWNNLKSGQPFKVKSATDALRREIFARAQINSAVYPTITGVSHAVPVHTGLPSTPINERRYSTDNEEAYHRSLDAARETTIRIKAQHEDEEKRGMPRRKMSGKERREIMRCYDSADEVLRRARENGEDWAKDIR